MKHNYIYKTVGAIVLTSMFASCHSDDNAVVLPQDDMVNLKFNIVNYEQYSLDELSTAEARATNSVYGGTRAAGTVSALAHLVLGVYDSEGQCYMKVLQDKGDAEYGNFSISLPHGE